MPNVHELLIDSKQFFLLYVEGSNREKFCLQVLNQDPSTCVPNLVRHYRKGLGAQQHVTVEHPSDLITLLRKRQTET